MATAAPPEIRVPVRDGERWQEGRTAPRSGPTSPSRPYASHRYGGPVSRLLGPLFGPLFDLFSQVAFWLAMALPVLYLPLVLAPATFDWSVPGVGLAASSGAVVVALVALHLATVVVGHGYARRLT